MFKHKVFLLDFDSYALLRIPIALLDIDPICPITSCTATTYYYLVVAIVEDFVLATPIPPSSGTTTTTPTAIYPRDVIANPIPILNIVLSIALIHILIEDICRRS